MRRSAVVVLLLLVSLATAASTAGATSTMNSRIVRVLRGQGLAGAGTGVAVVDISSGELLFRRNAWRPLVPASNEKLFTTVTALTTLHPGFRFTTRIVGVGLRAGHTWRGDLYLVGGGDPTFARDDLARLAALVARSGIHRVSGRIVGDETIYDPLRYGPRWKHAFDGIESPPLSGLSLDRDTDATGHIVANPPKVAARALRKALRAHGVTVPQRPVGASKAPAGAEELASVSSAPLWRITRFMDRWSDNFTAEMLLKAIGAYAGAAGSTQAGVAVEHQVLASLIPEDLPSIRIVDGSGLSSADHSTAAAFAHLLAAAARDPAIGKALDASLSVAGSNGTLEDRLQGVAGHRRVHGKTGTLDGVSSLSGYATTPNGQRYAFSILMNGRYLSVWRAHEAQDRIAAMLAGLR
jgi:D-alanyl-D-alanine carboxypeptidase/D-alanyl-D-alanine-endopeptidase (penicillin-binding protein 4)